MFTPPSQLQKNKVRQVPDAPKINRIQRRTKIVHEQQQDTDDDDDDDEYKYISFMNWKRSLRSLGNLQIGDNMTSSAITAAATVSQQQQ